MGANRHEGLATSVPDLTLERYRLAELPADAANQVAAALADDASLRSRLAAIDAADLAAQDRYAASALARDVRARVARGDREPQGARWVIPAAAMAALVLVLAVVWSPALDPARGVPVEEERVKGLEASLVVFRQVDGGSQQLADDSVARAGDLVRLGYRVTRAGYGIIVSVDGRGVLTQHLPGSGAHAVPLEPGTTVLLDEAFELDDAPRLERFYLVTAAEPFTVAPVLESLRHASVNGPADAGVPRVPDGLVITAFSLRKDRP